MEAALRIEGSGPARACMSIKTKLLCGFVLATVSVAMAGAASTLPLWQLVEKSGSATTVPISGGWTITQLL